MIVTSESETLFVEGSYLLHATLRLLATSGRLWEGYSIMGIVFNAALHIYQQRDALGIAGNSMAWFY